MARKLKFGIAASVIAVTIATAGVTTVTSFTFVPEAQAFSIKKSFKKAGRVVKRKAKITKEALTWETTKSMPGALKEAYGAMGKGAYKYTKRGVRKTIVSAKGAGVLAVSQAKHALPKSRIGDLPRGTKGYNTHDHRTSQTN